MDIEAAKIAVLMGGPGHERAVSLQSGKTISDALKQAGLNVISCDVTPDKLDVLDDDSIDLFFLALHGTFGEDGALQEILEAKNRPYTGADSRASRIAIDKAASKAAFASAGCHVTGHVIVEKGDVPEELAGQIAELGSVYVIKPVCEGSSVGIEITDDPQFAAQIGLACLDKFHSAMIEPFVSGREITVGIVDRQPLPLIEIQPTEGFYDYDAKYLSDQTGYVLDPVSDRALVERIQKDAMACYDAVGARHLSRVDFILDEENTPWVLEINTLPGFTSHSLLPMAARHDGIPIDQLCLRIAKAALDSFTGKS